MWAGQITFDYTEEEWEGMDSSGRILKCENTGKTRREKYLEQWHYSRTYMRNEFSWWALNPKQDLFPFPPRISFECNRVRYVTCSLKEKTETSVQFSHSIVSDSLRPMNHSTPGLPVHHQLLESTQTHVHCVGDATQPSHPLSSPSPPALNPSQHQGLFKWDSSLHQVAKYWSFSFSISPSNEHPGLISFRMDWLVSLQSKGLSRIFSNNTVQKHQFFGAQLSL